MTNFKVYTGRNRRKERDPRILWVTEDCEICEQLPEERRKEEDVLRALGSLVHSTNEREIAGIVFATVRRDGRIDLGAAGLVYDNPVVASGLIARLQAMLDAWPTHPGLGSGED